MSADRSAARDRCRDPLGWLLDTLPWPLRRIYFAARVREWPPDEARLIGCRRPAAHVFDYFKRLHGLD